MKKYLLILLIFPALLFSQQKQVMQYKIASVSDNMWIDPKKDAEIKDLIDRIAGDGYNVISVGTYKFMPAFFIDYSKTKYPEAQEFDSERIERNVSTFRNNIRYAKSKGIRYIVSRSYSLYAPYQFWKSNQDVLNPDNMFHNFLDKAHQNDIYKKTTSTGGKGQVIPHQQWDNNTFRKFFLYSTDLMLDIIPELDGFLNAYAESAWALDLDKVKENNWQSWKECINYEQTNKNFIEYCNTMYDMLKEKRGEDFFFGMRDWYVKHDVLRQLKMPKEDLVISVKYGGYDQPVVNYPPWGKDLQDEGYSVVLDMLVFDSEHPHPLYWYDNKIVDEIFSNIYKGKFAGVAYQDYMTKGNDSPHNPIRLLTQQTVSSAMQQKQYTDKEALDFLNTYYGKGNKELLKSLKAAASTQREFIKLMPAWFWEGDGLTPGGLQAYRYWMLMDNPSAPSGMSFIRENAVGVKEYVDAMISGNEQFRAKEKEWKKTQRKTPVQIMEEMQVNADIAIKSILEARSLSSADAPFMQDIVASAVIHKQLVLRQTAFLKSAIAYYESGYIYDDKYEKSNARSDTGIDKREECIAQLQKLIYHDKLLAELCRKFAPRRSERRGKHDYAFEKKIAKNMKLSIEIPELDKHEFSILESVILGKEYRCH